MISEPGTVKNLVVVPAYNEEETLPGSVEALDQLPPGYDVLIVDDGSTDATGVVAEKIAATPGRRSIRVVHLAENCGIGVAVQTGYLFAREERDYRYVVQFDADGQHDATSIPELVACCEREQLDLCVGSRFLGTDGFRSTAARRVGIRFLSTLVRALSGRRVTDPTSGLRCAGPRAWSAFARRYPDDYPEPESLFWCLRNGLRTGEVPVSMERRRAGESSIGSLRAAYYMVKVTTAILVDRLRRREGFAG